jgi:hypothetical protein
MERADIDRNIANCEAKIDNAKHRIKMAEATGEDIKMLKDRQKGYEKALKQYQSYLPKDSG